jgi:CcmD family protein
MRFAIGTGRLRGAALAFALGACAAFGAARAAQAQAPSEQAEAQAGTGAQGDAAEQRSQSFQAVRGAVKEDIAGGPLLLTAYAAIWVVLLLYVIRLVRLQQRALSDVQRLERVLSQSDTASR